MASIPSPALLGVQRVVIDCGPVSGLTDVERQAFCAQLVRKADALTDLPVSLASGPDADPASLAQGAEQLLLHVTATATPVDGGRKMLTIAVTPTRPGRQVVLGPLSGPPVSLVKVRDDWVLQGPVDAFIKVLAGTRGLHRPIVSDR